MNYYWKQEVIRWWGGSSTQAFQIQDQGWFSDITTSDRFPVHAPLCDRRVSSHAVSMLAVTRSSVVCCGARRCQRVWPPRQVVFAVWLTGVHRHQEGSQRFVTACTHHCHIMMMLVFLRVRHAKRVGGVSSSSSWVTQKTLQNHKILQVSKVNEEEGITKW